MIGVDVTFDFDVTVPNPPWMDANEDEILSVHSRRSRTVVLREAEEAAAVAKLQQGMLMMEEMGLCARFGTEMCRNMLMRNEADFEAAVDALMQLAPHSLRF
jgi:hypothetical protein